MTVSSIQTKYDENATSVGHVVSEALGTYNFLVYSVARQRWEITDLNGNFQGSVILNDGWVLLDFPLLRSWRVVHPSHRHIWGLLARNARIGAAKYVIEPQTCSCHLRADIPVDIFSSGENFGTSTLIRKACKDLVTACRKTFQGNSDGSESSAIDHSDQGYSLLEQCEQAGWKGLEAKPGQIRVDLVVTDAFYQASVESGSKGVWISVNLPCDNLKSMPLKCRWSLGLMLLRAAGLLRFVAASARHINGVVVIQFHVLLPRQPHARQLDYAFAGLSTACRLYATKAEALCTDVSLASAYLEMQEV